VRKIGLNARTGIGWRCWSVLARQHLCAAAVFVIVAIAFGCLLSGCGDVAADSGTSREQERGALAILRSPPERVPPSARAYILATLNSRLRSSLNIGSAQYTRTKAGGVWIVAVKSGSCLIQTQPWASACAGIASVTRHGLILGTFKPPARPSEAPTDFQLLGIAPDGVETAHLKVGRVTHAVAVRRGAYALRANSPITVVGLS
jgi:hypothetical protein